MYESFEVDGFRCFDHLRLSKLGRVNLIAGVNNVGKTALLESLFLHAGSYNPALVMKLNELRGIRESKVEFGPSGGAPWDSIFRNYEELRAVRLAGTSARSGSWIIRLKQASTGKELENLSQFFQETSKYVGQTGSGSMSHPAPEEEKRPRPSLGGSAKVLELEYEEPGGHGTYWLIIDANGVRIEPIPPNPPFPGYYISDRMAASSREEAELFGKLELENKQDALLRVLRLVEPKLKRLAMVMVHGEPTLCGDIGAQRLMPFPIMGGGMTRSLGLILRICNASHGVVLVDEIENGLHYSIMKELWNAIGELAEEFDTQIFATTHSRECIVNAHAAFAERRKGEFLLHRLERVKNNVGIISYDEGALAAAIETGLEVR